MQLLMLRIASVLVIPFIYMLFDLFNHRNVPDSFAYFTLGYGFVLTLLYFNTISVITSTAMALAKLWTNRWPSVSAT